MYTYRSTSDGIWAERGIPSVASVAVVVAVDVVDPAPVRVEHDRF